MAQKMITETARKIPVVAEADVLVVGGGTAGFPAAVAAARAGADVLLLERYGYVGGASSGGLVITIPEDRQGVYTKEVEERLIESGGGRTMPEHKSFGCVWDPEMLKWVGLKMLEEAGVRVLCHTMAVGALVEDGTVQGIVVESKAGRGAVLSRVVVDCTGDGDIAAFAGAPFEKGDADGEMLGVTMMFMMLGVDEDTFLAAKSEVDPSMRLGVCATRLHPGELNVWSRRLSGIDGTNPWDLTRCENELRKQVVDWAMWVKDNWPGCEDSHLSLTSPQLGVRETRRIVGDYMLTRADWEAEPMFEDHIGYAYEGKSVPYRTLLPQGVENLLVAGRCISTDHRTQDLMRIIPPCMVTGHAAGEAAAQAANDGSTPRVLDVEKFQGQLQGLGVPFPEPVAG